MLTQLRIASLGVIDEAVLELGAGFTAVTGETGAGKTMVVSSLGLLLGDKAEVRLIRHGSGRALVEGRITVDDAVTASVDALGGELDDGELLLTRVLTAARSRALVGGVQVPLGTLGDVVGERITIHGQSEQLRLGSSERQREVLDAFAGPELTQVLADYRAHYTEYRAIAAERAALVAAAHERARELAMLEFGLTEIEKAAPQAGEDAALRAEAKRLQATDDLRAGARAAMVALAGDDESYGDEPNAMGLVAAGRRALDGIAEDDPDVGVLAGRVAEAGYLLADAAGELASYLAGLDADPARLEWIAERLSALQGLTRRYGDSVDDVLAWGAEAAARASELRGSDDRIETLTAALASLDAELDAEASRLRALRTAAASELKGLVEAELGALALPRASCAFEVTRADRGVAGADHVQLLFSANPGSAPAPLAKVASGGELSRVRLALEVVLASAEKAEGRTFVFDEVDAGVGGAVALEIGRRLARLARTAQVIVVTHLAQVAAFADRQYVVAKADDGQVTTSGVREVMGEERVGELARMMAGLDGTDAARAHAEELLDAARGV
jgi:DNA repair protein RecN (Recombination protein N)